MEGLSRTDQHRATSYCYLLTDIGGWQYFVTTNAAFYMRVKASFGVSRHLLLLLVVAS